MGHVYAATVIQACKTCLNSLHSGRLRSYLQWMLTLLSQPKHLNWLILAINSRGIVPTPTKRPWTRLPLPLELPSARYFRDPQPLNSNNLRSLGNHYMHTYVCACVRLCVRLEVGYTLQTFIYLAVVLMAFPAWSSQYSDITMVVAPIRGVQPALNGVTTSVGTFSDESFAAKHRCKTYSMWLGRFIMVCRPLQHQPFLSNKL